MEFIRGHLLRGDRNQYVNAPSSLDWAVLIYLTIPLLLFIVGWTYPLIGIPSVLATVFSIHIFPVIFRRPDSTKICVAAVTSFLNVRYSGISPWLNSVPLLDITKHRWLLNDLISHPWPVYLHENGTDYILRYSLGFYLVPALISKLIGHISQAPFLIWMMLGTFLFLLLALDTIRYRWLIVPVTLAVVFFGGLDVIGVTLTSPYRTGAGLGEFSEDWAINPYGWLIASNSFAFSWSPQHAIAGWLGGALLLRNWDRPWFQRRVLGIAAALAFWSPFTALSFGGIFSILASRQWVLRKGSCAIASLPNMCALLPLVILCFYYTLGHAADEHFVFSFTWDFIGLYLRFVFIEFGIFWILCFMIIHKNTPELTSCLIILLVYPMFRIGSAVNDLVMSGSRLPLMVLMLLVLRAIQENGHATARFALVALACVGIYGGFNESYRLLRAPKVQADWTASILSMDRTYRPQYIAPLPVGGRAWIFPGCSNPACAVQK